MSTARRFATLPSLAADTLLTLLAAVFAAANFVVGDRGPGGLSGWAIPLALLCAVALLLRSRWPLWTLLAVGLAGALYLLVTGRPTFAILPSVFIALYSAIAFSPAPRRQVWALALAVSVALGAVALVSERDRRPPPNAAQRPRPPAQVSSGIDLNLPENVRRLLLDAGWMLTALVLGEAMRSRRAYAAEAEERAAQAERAQQEVAHRRVVEERLQIARELHDVLAHTVAVINVQAGVAAHVIDQRPEQAREALNHIKEASRATLQELRALVGVLRDTDSATPHAPTSGLAALDSLVEAARDAGLGVTVEAGDLPDPLPATIDLAAYRILQEALTNVIKHAGAVAVTVRVARQGGNLELEVTNQPGDRPPAMTGHGPGHGITGMRERAAALGGTLAAGPLPGGGHRVHAALPLTGGGA